MPEATSGYDVTLETVEGDSTQALSNGLYYAMGIGGQYGYTFFYDNDGVLRYEMVLEMCIRDRLSPSSVSTWMAVMFPALGKMMAFPPSWHPARAASSSVHSSSAAFFISSSFFTVLDVWRFLSMVPQRVQEMFNCLFGGRQPPHSQWKTPPGCGRIPPESQR